MLTLPLAKGVGREKRTVLVVDRRSDSRLAFLASVTLVSWRPLLSSKDGVAVSSVAVKVTMAMAVRVFEAGTRSAEMLYAVMLMPGRAGGGESHGGE